MAGEKLPFLFEIGTEEIPASYLPNYAKQMTELLDGFFTEAGLSHDKIICDWTPRRLAFFTPALQTVQAVKESDVKGPPTAVAFKDGIPTKAAEAFAAKTGLSVDALGRIEEGGREYLFARVKTGGALTSQLLREKIPALIKALRSPKSMRWDVKPTLFARPIRSLVVLLGEEIIPCDLDGLVASNLVNGHRFLNPGPFVQKSANWVEYRENLRAHSVLLSYEERCATIKAQLLALGGREESLDYDLLETCANLTEFPKAVKGKIAEDYLALPPEVLITTLKKHQKSFPCYGSDGKLEAAFLSVTNNDLKEESIIKTGYERVITARLADAKFFWDEDRKTPLSERVEKLKNVIFQKDLGTYYAKVVRVQKIVELLGKLTGKTAEAAVAAQAALISRADLTTAMVFEFPELQGTMGRIYAKVVDGLTPEAANAIEEMYQPRGANDAVPASLPGALLSIADKFDTIIGCVMVGLAPTGSADPYMLRRQTFGMLKTIIAHKLVFQLSELAHLVLKLLYEDSEAFKQNLAEAFAERFGLSENPDIRKLENIADGWFRPLPHVKSYEKQLIALFQGRFETVLKDLGVSYDIIQAVFGAPWPGIYINTQKALQLQAMKNDASFLTLCNVLERCVNIAKDEKKGKAAEKVETTLFSEEAEKKLWEAWQEARPAAAKLREEHRFGEAVALLAAKVAEPLDKYFNEVRIYADDAAVRSNRLAVLKEISETIKNGLADLSKVVPANQPKN